MITIMNCIAYAHDPFFFALAVITLLIGSQVTMRLFARVRRSEHDIRKLWLVLCGIIGGGTIWSTHFVSMLAYESDVILGYEPVLTIASLLIVVATTSIGFYIASLSQRSYLIEIGGAILGLGISAMHYTGMAAISVSGTVNWNMEFVVSSVLFGAIFGALATNRIARPITRFCKYGSSLSFILAVAMMHFTSMSGLIIVPMNLDTVPQELISDEMLGASVLIVMALLFFTTFITNLIDTKNNEATTQHYKYLALNDPLTGVLNRRGSEQHLEQLLMSKKDTTAGVAILTIDLDRFKDTNDVYGHAAGDHLLRTIVDRVKCNLRKGEMIGRFGGDEFVAIKSSVYNKREVADFGDRILNAVRAPIEWKNVTLTTTASIGYSSFPQDGSESIELMEKSDQAMYRAKTNGRNCIVAYDMEMDSANKEKISLTLDLSNAIERGEFEIHYQLQNNTKTKQIVGVEALLRWNHPERGSVSPGVFIPLAEESGFIIPLGSWVLMQACTEVASWEVPVKVAVNIASQQICDPNLPNEILDILSKTGLSPSLLEVEITESGIISDMDQALQVIQQLKTIGITVAMDDYGTGYSSLSTLQRFPFDKIKIDREFVKEIESNDHSAAIIRSTLILAQSLNIPVLAEGVETTDQLSLLDDLECEQVQGFLFGRPMPAADVKSILQEAATNEAISHLKLVAPTKAKVA